MWAHRKKRLRSSDRGPQRPAGVQVHPAFHISVLSCLASVNLSDGHDQVCQQHAI